MLANIPPILLICSGACMGATARWQLGLALNHYWHVCAMGTLAANWLGCLLIGITMAYSLHDNYKLLLITGFLGSFTTFSSFSAEIIGKLQAAKWLDAIFALSLHLIGGLSLTILGFAITRYLKN